MNSAIRWVKVTLCAGWFFAVGGVGADCTLPPRMVISYLAGGTIFLVDYGLVFWAEQRVPSGVTAVMLATIPVFAALGEILILRTQRVTFRLGCALQVGLAGVAVLVSRSVSLGDAPIERSGAIALVVGASVGRSHRFSTAS